MYIHPQYNDLPVLLVFEGILGEHPIEGCFYSAKPGDTLINIAERAYGAPNLWGAINDSQWNKDHCVYRAVLDSCTAEVTDQVGYLSICEHYPIIWIPILSDVYDPGESVEDSPPLQIDPLVSGIAPLGDRPFGRKPDSVPGDEQGRVIFGMELADQEEITEEEKKTKTTRILLWAALGITLAVALVYVSRRK
jgi:hypothetical protein